MIHFIQRVLKIQKKIKNTKQLENFQYNITFDECSTSQITSNVHRQSIHLALDGADIYI